MRATITVYGVPSSGKTDWLGQVKRALLATAPLEAVEVTVHESHKTVFGWGTAQFDEFTIPAADADGTAGVAGDRETWSIVPTGSGYHHVNCGTKRRASFLHRADALSFMTLKTADEGRRIAAGRVLTAPAYKLTLYASEQAALDDPENCKGGGGEIAEGAGVIPRGIYWCNVGGNFYDAITHHGQGAQFYRAWAARRAEFPQSENLTLPFANGGPKLSAAEAPAIHDAVKCGVAEQAMRKVACGMRLLAADITNETRSTTWPTYRKNHYFAYADRVNGFAAELEVDSPKPSGWPTPMVPRAERDEARRERDVLRNTLANVITYLNGCKNLDDALRDVAALDRAS